MADPLSILAIVTAGMQCTHAAAQALLLTIKLVKDLQEIPKRLAVLLSDVDASISRLCHLCDGLLQSDSKAFSRLSTQQRDHLAKSSRALHPALQEIHTMLTPLVGGSQGKGKPLRRFWKALVSLKLERDLAEKLERLDRLNLDVIRELGVVGLEVQMVTNELITVNHASSGQGFSDIHARLDSLQADFQGLTLVVSQANALTPRSHHELMQISGLQLLQQQARPVGWGASRANSSSSSISGSTLFSPDANQDAAGRDWDLWQDQGRVSPDREERMRRYLLGGAGPNTTSGRLIPISPLQNANLGFVLFNVRTFYTTGNFDTSGPIIKSKFWQDTETGIYLMKVSDEARAFALLQRSTVDAHNVLHENNAALLIEILSTLSSANTTTIPLIRQALFRLLSALAKEQLPRDHPIALVINILKGDDGDKEITFRTLLFISERLRSILGPVHELSLLAVKRLVALLRRSGEFSEALRVCNDAIRSIRASIGPGSLQERQMSRQLEHIYIDQGDLPSALSVCFDIIRQRLDTEYPNPDPQLHDECAVYTMEDIAKICECGGNLDQAGAWLKQARISGGMVWDSTAALAHIQDKLEKLLTRTGGKEEAELWRQNLAVTS